jgi:hypothetical protein
MGKSGYKFSVKMGNIVWGGFVGKSKNEFGFERVI